MSYLSVESLLSPGNIKMYENIRISRARDLGRLRSFRFLYRVSLVQELTRLMPGCGRGPKYCSTNAS